MNVLPLSVRVYIFPCVPDADVGGLAVMESSRESTTAMASFQLFMPFVAITSGPYISVPSQDGVLRLLGFEVLGSFEPCSEAASNLSGP